MGIAKVRRGDKVFGEALDGALEDDGVITEKDFSKKGKNISGLDPRRIRSGSVIGSRAGRISNGERPDGKESENR